jgi:hypothetical protein
MPSGFAAESLEGGERLVARGFNEAAVVALDLGADQLAVAVAQGQAGGLAAGSHRRRAHDVGEQDGGEAALRSHGRSVLPRDYEE